MTFDSSKAGDSSPKYSSQEFYGKLSDHLKLVGANANHATVMLLWWHGAWRTSRTSRRRAEGFYLASKTVVAACIGDTLQPVLVDYCRSAAIGENVNQPEEEELMDLDDYFVSLANQSGEESEGEVG